MQLPAQPLTLCDPVHDLYHHSFFPWLLHFDHDLLLRSVTQVVGGRGHVPCSECLHVRSTCVGIQECCHCCASWRLSVGTTWRYVGREGVGGEKRGQGRVVCSKFACLCCCYIGQHGARLCLQVCHGWHKRTACKAASSKSTDDGGVRSGRVGASGVQVRQYTRLAPLVVARQALGSLEELQPGDCLVAFSRRAVSQWVGSQCWEGR
jgi:hypothetical protein